MERCILTGSSGFLGSALSAELSNQGFKVTPLTRDWETIPKDTKYIYYLATYGNMYDQTDEEEIFRVNVAGTYRLLKATEEIPYKRMVYVSSSSVLLPNQTAYSKAKCQAEVFCESFRKPISIVRPYSVTGVGEQESHLIPTLIRAAYSGEEVPFVPTPRHDFIDIEDVVRNLISISQASRGTYPIGSGKSYSNQEVLAMVEYVTGKTINTREVESLRSYDTTDWKAPYSVAHKPLLQSIGEMVKAYDRK